MPTYQYACTSCGEQLEVVQKFTDDPLTVCSACGGELRKVYSAVGIVFKGSGFYRTDSRAEAKSRAGAAKGSSDSSPDGSSSGGESTPSKTGLEAGGGLGQAGGGLGQAGRIIELEGVAVDSGLQLLFVLLTGETVGRTRQDARRRKRWGPDAR